MGEARYAQMPVNETWSGTTEFAWIHVSGKIWLGRKWVCLETGAHKWEPVETVNLDAPPSPAAPESSSPEPVPRS